LPKKTFFALEKEKQERIVNAAIIEFSQSSFSKVTIDKIVLGAKIPKGSFYQYFSDKEDIYKYLFQKLTSEKKEELEKNLKVMEGVKFQDFIRSLYVTGTQFAFQDQSRMELQEKFIWNCRQELREEILEIMIADSNEILIRVLEYYKNIGEIKPETDTETAAEMLTALTIFISKSLNRESRNSFTDIMAKIENMLAIVMPGLLRGHNE